MPEINIAEVKAAIDRIVDILKGLVEKMTWFINGWKKKSELDKETTEAATKVA